MVRIVLFIFVDSQLTNAKMNHTEFELEKQISTKTDDKQHIQLPAWNNG